MQQNVKGKSTTPFDSPQNSTSPAESHQKEGTNSYSQGTTVAPDNRRYINLQGLPIEAGMVLNTK